MRHIRNLTFLLPLMMLSAFLASCAKDFQGDIDKLNTTYTSIEQRAGNLETQLNTVNTQLQSLSVLSAAVEQGFYITAVKSTADGYELTLSNGRIVSLLTTPSGTLTPMPALSMTQINGLFFWTLNGVLFTDNNGNPIRSTGQTPVLKYDYTINQWVVSIDGGATFSDISTYASLFINDEVLMQVINSFANSHNATLFNKQLLYQIVYSYMQQSYKELFNVEILNEVVANYVKEHYARIFNYTLLEKIFSQYNFEYVTNNIKVDELVSVIVSFIQEHGEILEDNEVLYEIVSSFLKANKTSIFTEEMLCEAVNKFIEENQNYINIDLLTQVVTNYIDTHRDMVFDTETVRNMLMEYVRRYYVKAFSEDILIRVFNICMTQNNTAIFNETLLTDIINQYIKGDNFYSVISQEAITTIVRDYINRNSSTVFNRNILVEVINNFLKTYKFQVEQSEVERLIDEYILTYKTQIVDIDIVKRILEVYIDTYYRELFNVNVLRDIVINYLKENKEVIVKNINLGNDVIKSVDINDDLCTIKLSNGQEVMLVVYDAWARLSKRVQSIVAMTPDGHFEDSQPFTATYLVSPASMANVIKTKYPKDMTLELKGIDANGSLIGSFAVSTVMATDGGELQVSANLDTKKVKAVALYVRENKIAGTDILTEFTVIGEGTPCRGDIPDDPNPNDTPALSNTNAKIPYPTTGIGLDECGNYVATMNLTGIQDPNTGDWIDLYGTGKYNQNMWVEVDETAKGIVITNLEDNTNRVKNDIVFTVDNSGSMSDEADAIASGIKQWASMLDSKGLDVRFGIVGYGYTYKIGITGAIDLTSSDEISSYLNRSTGCNRTRGFGGSNATKLQSAYNENTIWNTAVGENGVRAVRFANENFTFRQSSNRIYINFTDDCNKTDGISAVSVNYFKDKTNWPVTNGTIHSIISCDTTTIKNRAKNNVNQEIPWLMSRYTNGTVKKVNENASDLNLNQLTVSDAIIHSYTIRFIIPESLLDGKEHTVRMVVKANNGTVRGILEFQQVFRQQ